MTVDLEAIAYLERLEQRLTGILHLTNCTPAWPVLWRLLAGDLRPTIASCYAELDQMAEQLQGRENDYFYEEGNALAD